MSQVDFIIVGAGSAGCVLAHELSANGKNRVLVLETGPTDRHPFVKIPLGYGLLFNNKARNYRYNTAAEPNLAGRELYYPRGKTVGGSGSINAMVYTRGLPVDYDDWRDQGATGWSWQDVEPFFEMNEDGSSGNAAISVTDPVESRHPFTRHFEQSAQELGVRSTNGNEYPSPAGTDFFKVTTRSGFRHTSADAFLRPALKSGSVELKTTAVTQKILFEGRRATGVTYRHAGQTITATATKAVILSAGAVNSPQLLQLSGVGNGEHLRELDVETVIHNPNVGAHLQDHLAVGYFYESDEATMNQQLHSLVAKAWQTVRYVTTRTGPLSTSINQYGGYVSSGHLGSTIDQQLYFNPATYTVARAANKLVVQTDAFPGFTLCFQPTRPTSRGTIRAVSSEIEEAPEISLNALATEEDRAAVVGGGRLIERFLETDSIKKVTKQARSPSPDTMSDAEIIDDFRERCGTNYHPCGSCRIGPSDENAVVDPELRVHNAQNLYVVDASVFPSITSGNINAPTLMVARKAASHILSHYSG